jgi:plastocyanin
MYSNTLDSRALGFGDCYGQRFMKPGTYRYDVVTAGGGPVVTDFRYTIEVVANDGGATMKQHDVILKTEGRGFVVDQEVMTISEGDLVLWACADATAHAFEVRGDQAFFGSAALTNECGYSHAFGTPGEHRWADALGGPAEGVVRVKDVRCATPAELTAWRKRLTRGTVVMISDGKVEPAEVDVVLGQRVFFAVVSTSPMTITETALIAACDRKK